MESHCILYISDLLSYRFGFYDLPTFTLNFFIYEKKMTKGLRVPKLGFRVERDFVTLLQQGGRFSEKSLGVSALQAAQPPYSVRGPHKMNWKTSVSGG